MNIPDFKHSQVLVCGDVMLDQYWTGPTSRISPEAPVPVVNVQEDEIRLGGAANVALNVQSLGGKVCLSGLIGNDQNANKLLKAVEAKNIIPALHKIKNRETILKLRIMSQNQQLIRLDFEQSFADCDQDNFLKDFERQLEYCNMVLLSDYAKGTLKNITTLIQAAKQKNLPVIIDPKSTSFEPYRGAFLLTPNLKEFEGAVGISKDEDMHEDEMVAKAQALLDKHDIHAMLITRGKHGMLLVEKNQQPVTILTAAREVFDVTGAGDTVIAVIAAAVSAGSSLVEAVRLANIAAGIVIGKVGTSTVSCHELRHAVDQQTPSASSVMNEESLLHAIKKSRDRNEKIVMTNGCFDVIHAGHIQILEEARALGDRLIVAVNDDDSIRRLKGESRPINPLPDRMRVLAGLKAVDWVIPFSEDTPEDIICKITPNILVKGKDYKEEDVAGGAHVKAHGGEVALLDLRAGFSTTKILEKIKKETV